MKSIQQFLNEANEERNMAKKNSVKAIIFNDNKILLLRRQNDTPGEGQFDLPGGCIETNEAKIDALKREVFEETGLKITKEKFVKTVNLKIPETGIDSDMSIYTAESDSGNVILKPATWKGADGKTEHNEYKWITDKTELESLPMLGILKPVIMKYLK